MHHSHLHSSGNKMKRSSVPSANLDVPTFLSPTLLMRGAGRSLRTVGTPKVWWVWSGGAPPTTWTTSDEDLYSERVFGEVGVGPVAPGGGNDVMAVHWVMLCSYRAIHDDS